MFRVSPLLLLLVVLGCNEEPIPEPVAPVEPTLPPDAELLAARPYQVVTPPELDGGAPLPLLLALHGYGSSGHTLDDEFELSRLAQSRGFLLVLPNATPDARGLRAWRPFALPKSPFDREYLRAVIAQMKADYPVDPSRVFVFGYSQGGHMAHRMGCDASDQVAALVSLAGQAATDPAACLPTQAVSALQVHGTADEAIGYQGDVSPPIDPDVPSAHDTIAVWGRLDGCGALTQSDRTLDLSSAVEGPETTVEEYQGCPQGIGVELWTMHEVQHWPVPRSTFMAQLYAFLALHPRP